MNATSNPFDEDEKRVRWLYLWLLLSPLLTVPWMGYNFFTLSARADSTEWLTSILLPALPHLLVLPWGWRSSSIFVRRHTQQASLLMGLRLLSASLLLGLAQGGQFCAWVIVSGNLWLWGSIGGWRQVVAGDCWLMHWFGDFNKLGQKQASMGKNRALPAAALSPEFKDVPQLLHTFRYGTSAERDEAINILEKLGEIELF